MNKRVVFKKYDDQSQQMLPLPSYDDLVPKNSCEGVKEVVDIVTEDLN